MKEKIKIDVPSYLFHQGKNYYSYDFLGVHSYFNEKNEEVFVFRVWAPHAEAVYVVGDFNNWQDGVEMELLNNSEIWQAHIKLNEKECSHYKYKIINSGRVFYKADPYAFFGTAFDGGASVIWSADKYEWSDDEWLKLRCSVIENQKASKHFYSAPLNIYEMHLGSWKTRDSKPTEDRKHYLNYREIADMLAPYIKKMGYTHVELLPVMEHPFDGSWGYQVSGYYAPTSRYGTPDDFRYFINKLHTEGIGIILDWVPAHFPKDAHGLYEFDGQPLYEYTDPARMEHNGWGTRFFDVGKNEVKSFLISNALFWLREYHVDGLRIDAVASMLYLDCDKAQGEWKPNKFGDNRNLEAISFFQELNTAVFAEFPDVLMAAEESTSWGMVTKPVAFGGLGFNFKWNMGWSNDLFDYVKHLPNDRKKVHSKLTFPMMYAFNENYILPVSHDEVVHGKKSLVDKMAGEYNQKFASMRVFMLYMMTLPGKKLSFMGNEFAQFREWDYKNELEWFILKYPRHIEMSRFVEQLNQFYLNHSELWEIDDSWDGFEWIETNQSEFCTLSYKRKNIVGKELIVILNFSEEHYGLYKVKIPKGGMYEEIFTTDLYCYGGNGTENKELNARPLYKSKKSIDRTRAYILNINLAPLSGIVLKKK